MRQFKCIKKCAFINFGEISDEVPKTADHVLFQSEHVRKEALIPGNDSLKNFHDIIIPLCLIVLGKEYFEEINVR